MVSVNRLEDEGIILDLNKKALTQYNYTIGNVHRRNDLNDTARAMELVARVSTRVRGWPEDSHKLFTKSAGSQMARSVAFGLRFIVLRRLASSELGACNFS